MTLTLRARDCEDRCHRLDIRGGVTPFLFAARLLEAMIDIGGERASPATHASDSAAIKRLLLTESTWCRRGRRRVRWGLEPFIGLSSCGARPATLCSSGPDASYGPAPGYTDLLDEWGRGDRRALDELLPLVYGELRRVAARQLRHEEAEHTLQPTALVHEADLRLVDQRRVHWQNRAHFFGVAAHVMRRILVDHARRHLAGKRGHGVRPVPIDRAMETPGVNEIPVLELDDALDRLASLDAGLAQFVELRAFGGLTIHEAAHVLNVSPSTAKREWRTAKAWLTRELGTDGSRGRRGRR